WFRYSWPTPLHYLNLPGLGFGSFRQMHSQHAVVELGRHFVTLNAVGNIERPFPIPPNPFVTPELLLRDSGRCGTLAPQREDAAAETQFEVGGDRSREFGGQQILAIELVKIDRRKRAIEPRKWKGETLEQPI